MNTPVNPACPMNEQSVGWALHALEPDEEMAVLLHLPQCLSCQDTVLNAESTLAHLGVSVDQVDPPPSLRESLLARAVETPQQPPMLRPRRSPESAVPRPEAPASRHRVGAERPPTRSGSERPRRGASWLSRRGRRIAAATLALLGLLAVGGLTIRTTQLEQQRDAAQAQSITDLVALAPPGSQHALLASTGNGSTVAAVVVADGRRQVFPAGLPANDADRNTYVLWGVRAGADPQPVGTFDVSGANRGARALERASATDDFTAYAISLEPGRIAPTKPTEVVAKGSVEA